MPEAFEIQNIERIQARLREVIGGLEDAEPLFLEIAHYIRLQIEIRTAEGVDVDGRAFKPYSPAYALFRMESGHSVTPNLFFTGSMMSAMTPEAGADFARVFFMNTSGPGHLGLASSRSGAYSGGQEISNPLKALFLNEDRHFFGLSDEDVQTVMDMITKHVDRLMEG